MEPSILYNTVVPRKQLPSECVANAVCTMIEKYYAVQGTKIDLDEARFDNELRASLGKTELTGVSMTEALERAKKGVYDKKGKLWKIKNWYRNTLYATKINLFQKGVIAVSRKACVLNIKNGVATIKSMNENKGHAVVCFGYDADKGFLFVDSKYDEPYHLSESDFEKVYKRSYYITI